MKKSCQSQSAQFDLTWIPTERANLILFLKTVFSWLLVLHSTTYCPDGIPFFSQEKSAYHTNLKSAWNYCILKYIYLKMKKG